MHGELEMPSEPLLMLCSWLLSCLVLIAQGLQAMGHVAVAADKLVTDLKKDYDEVASSMRKVRQQSEVGHAMMR